MGQNKSSYLKIGILIVLTLVIAGLIMACGSTPTPLPLQPEEKVEENVKVAEVPPPTPTTAPTPTPTPVVIASSDSCESCHTDKEQLIATADEEEAVEELSEGEG